MNHLLNVQIKDAAPHIFRRPFLLVERDTRMLQIATFLAIGPQIYVDGLMVIDDKGQRKPVGKAAELLMDIRNPCLILQKQEERGMYNSIVTPWDVVMKILKL